MLASEQYRRYLDCMSKFHRYSFHNKLLISIQKPAATKVMGFRQWNKLNRYVRKGEKSIRILAPLIKTRKDKESGLEDKVCVGFKPVSVFDISQTDGEPLPELEILVGGDDFAPFLSAVEYCCQKRDIELAYGDLFRGVYGLSTGGMVMVSDNLGMTDKAQVLVHEVAHELLHYDAERDKPDTRTKETEAEGVSYVVCRHFGLKTPACNYLAKWKSGSKQILESLQAISATSASIISDIEEYYKNRPEGAT